MSQTIAPAPDTESFAVRSRRHLRQFLKFGMVGGSGVLVNMVVDIIMTKLHGGVRHNRDVVLRLFGDYAIRYTILTWVVAFIVANFWNFQLNRSWTFKREHRRGWWAEFWPFFAVGSVAAVAGIFIKTALTNHTSPLYLPSPWFDDSSGLRAREYWSQLITIVITMPINFVVNKLWTFRAVQHHRDDELPMVAPVVDPDEVSEAGGIEQPRGTRA